MSQGDPVMDAARAGRILGVDPACGLACRPDALRAAYEETRGRGPPLPPPPQARPAMPSAVTIDVPISIEEPSLVVDVAFGEHHEMAREPAGPRDLLDLLAHAGTLCLVHAHDDGSPAGDAGDPQARAKRQ